MLQNIGAIASTRSGTPMLCPTHAGILCRPASRDGSQHIRHRLQRPSENVQRKQQAYQCLHNVIVDLESLFLRSVVLALGAGYRQLRPDFIECSGNCIAKPRVIGSSLTRAGGRTFHKRYPGETCWRRSNSKGPLAENRPTGPAATQCPRASSVDQAEATWSK